jgi:hypothetical protein
MVKLLGSVIGNRTRTTKCPLESTDPVGLHILGSRPQKPDLNYGPCRSKSASTSGPVSPTVRRYLDPVFTGNNKLQPLYGLLNGQSQRFPNGSYYLRFSGAGRPQWESAGPDAKEAALKKLRREQILAAHAAGLTILGPNSCPSALAVKPS